MFELITVCKTYLKLKYPVRIEFKNKIWKNCLGVHWTECSGDKIKCHIIKLSLNQLTYDIRGVNEVLAHEFVHAWQAEYRPIRKKYHTPSFAKKAKELQEFLNHMGIEVNDIYLPDIDKS